MIDAVQLSKVATFGESVESLTNLSQFNFVFGTNGCGKTTISRVIANEVEYPTCRVVWRNGTRLQTMVYNRDFVERNFSQNNEMPGIFTLGEEQLDLHKQIAIAKSEADILSGSITALTKTLQGDDGKGGKLGELAVLENSLRDKCWAQKIKHDAAFHGAFKGLRNNAEEFKKRVLKELNSNKATCETIDYLQKRADTLFGPSPTNIPVLSNHDTTILLGLESSAILTKRVIGSADVDISAMIQKLGNSDWVKEGRKYYEANESICPFCQGPTQEEFESKLAKYFDDTFSQDIEAIARVVQGYKDASYSYQTYLDSVIKLNSKYLDTDALAKEKQIIDAAILSNIQTLENKKKEPSSCHSLISLKSTADTASSLIDSANAEIAEHNRIVSNFATEKATLTAQVWRFLLDVELKSELHDYQLKKSGIDKAVASLTKQVADTQLKLKGKNAEIRELEKRMTSVKPTIDAVNTLLKSFGFCSFSLAEGATESSYKLIRSDGSTARETLSEGEKTFVTFLYFYHLLRGSTNASGITTDRVVVIDDPVSSLDSDILFIVGSLIKALFDDVRNEKGFIKQIIVLTHNVYFHKEVSFNPKRSDVARTDETFWIVRKLELTSRIQNYGFNPIKTSYELLWDEVKNRSESNPALQNTLRRILESYFRILGNIDPDTICSKFEGKQQLICKSLFSWVNDGSHSAHDDLFVSIDGTMVQAYLEVFRQVFEKTDHLSHYNMMMGQPQSNAPTVIITPKQ